MPFIEGCGRDQQVLFPERLDDYVSSDNAVRFIDAFVRSLDLRNLGVDRPLALDLGRPPYDPRDLLALLIYGYLYSIRSSRKLERECHRNVELMWLLYKLRPDFKTIADFRRDNKETLRRVCREFTVLCRKMDLFGKELVGIDGSKFRAVNSKDRSLMRKTLQEMVGEIDQRIERYLTELEAADQADDSVAAVSIEQLRQRIEELRNRTEEYQILLEEMARLGQNEISLTDPDSRRMLTGGKVVEVCYNVQVAVDEKHKLIVANDVTNDPTDARSLDPMARGAQEMLGVKELKVVADLGYASGRGVRECLASGITPYVAKPQTSANTPLGLFAKDDFTYDVENDCYICPAEQRLTFRFETEEKGRQIRYYETNACGHCPLKSRCTRNKRNRRITRSVDEHLLEQTHARVAASPELMNKRAEIVEHPFGTMKRSMNQGYFLTRGLDSVKAEFSLTVLAYNIKRVLNLVTVPEMIAALV